MKKNPYDIFISYASEDELYAKEINSSLTHLGFTVWFAPLTLKIGSRLLDSINAGLLTSNFSLIILSQAYISKAWTKYELDILHRHHIENEKTLFPIWHNIDKQRLDLWNPGISGIFALQSSLETNVIAEKIANIICENAHTRGVSPIYEDPQWRFLQGLGELHANNNDGPVFNIFEAVEFPDKHFPLYVHKKLYTKNDLVREVAKIIGYRRHEINPDLIKKMIRICKDYGFDTEASNFDPAYLP